MTLWTLNQVLNFSVDRDIGQFITVDAAYDPTTFAASKPTEEFKKSKKKKEENPVENDDWFVSKIQHVDLHKEQETDKDFYRQIVTDTLALSEEELITPNISRTFSLDDVNEAVEFIKRKKGTGKVLIDVKQQKVQSDDKGKTTKSDD